MLRNFLCGREGRYWVTHSLSTIFLNIQPYRPGTGRFIIRKPEAACKLFNCFPESNRISFFGLKRKRNGPLTALWACQTDVLFVRALCIFGNGGRITRLWGCEMGNFSLGPGARDKWKKEQSSGRGLDRDAERMNPARNFNYINCDHNWRW